MFGDRFPESKTRRKHSEISKRFILKSNEKHLWRHKNSLDDKNNLFSKQLNYSYSTTDESEGALTENHKRWNGRKMQEVRIIKNTQNYSKEEEAQEIGQ